MIISNGKFEYAITIIDKVKQILFLPKEETLILDVVVT